MSFIVFVLLVLLACYITYRVVRYRLKHKVDTITAYTGGLGAGKTLYSVNDAIKRINKQVFKYYHLENFKNYFRKHKKEVERPILLSNIPICINKKKQRYSVQLTKEHLLLQERIPLHSVVMLDEIGAFASQFDFKEQNVIKVFDEFIRFYRHYTQGGYIIVNDQCSENINLVIRRRLNIVHNLSNCLVLLKKFCFVYDRQITISEEIKTIDVADVDSQSVDTQDNKRLCFRILRKNAYDTYCYKERYYRVPKKDNMHQWKSLLTNDLLRCPKDKENKYVALTEESSTD